MGDIILTSPVLRAIHDQVEGQTEIHFLCKKQFEGLLEANPRIQKIHSFEKTVQEVLPQLELEHFDYIIDLHRNIRSAVVKRRLKCLSFTFDKLNFEKWLLVNFGWNRMPELHVVDRYLQTLKGFGAKDDGLGLEYYIPMGQELPPDKAHILSAKSTIAVVIGGAHEGKRPSALAWISWLAPLQQSIVLIGGKEDGPLASEIASQVKVLNWVGELTVHQSADVLSRAEVVISGDTGMMHIAAAFGRKIISIWGCTAPSLGMAPYRGHEASIILEPKGRKKRPCSKLGNRCKYGMKQKCVDQITPEQVAQAIEKLWVL